MRRRAYACVALAVAAIAALLAITLSHTAQRRSGSNGVATRQELGLAGPGDRFCQPREMIPADTTALQVSLSGDAPLLVTLTRRGRVLERVDVPFGWSSGGFVVPIRRTRRDIAGVDVCFIAGRGAPVTLLGAPAPAPIGRATLNGRPTSGSLRIDALRPGRESWLAYLPTIVRRIGRDRGGWGGPWIAWLILALTLASWATAWHVVRRTVLGAGASVRTTAAAIAVVAALNAAAWSFISPAFQIPDESVHVAYVQEVGEAGRPPLHKGPQSKALSPELRTALLVARTEVGPLMIAGAGVWTATEEQRLEQMLSRPLPRRGNGDAGASDDEPPLYYALEAIPYRLLHGGTLLTRLAGMRLLSALLGGATAAFVFLFVRECLPRRPWAWSVGGLVTAFVPLLGFMSGGVNPDVLLFPLAAALFLCLARAFRRGMTRRRALWIGITMGIGLLAKLNFDSLVPGALLATALVARRSEGRWNRRVVALTAAVAALGFAPTILVNGFDAVVWGRPFVPEHTQYTSAYHGSLAGKLSFLWQLYLPRLPGMRRLFAVDVPYDVWFKELVGNFGFLTLPLPQWAYRAALALFALLGALAGRAVIVRWATVRRRWQEALSYLAMVAGLLALIAYVLMQGWAPGLLAGAQGRYLLPLLALFGAFMALAARGAGERWGPPVGATLVVVAIGWSLLGQLVAIAGYYT